MGYITAKKHTPKFTGSSTNNRCDMHHLAINFFSVWAYLPGAWVVASQAMVYETEIATYQSKTVYWRPTAIIIFWMVISVKFISLKAIQNI